MIEYDETLDSVIANAPTQQALTFARWKLQASMQLGVAYLAYIAPLTLAGADDATWWLGGCSHPEQLRQVQHVLHRDLARIARDVTGQPITLIVAEGY
jgi:hypothetical protein